VSTKKPLFHTRIRANEAVKIIIFFKEGQKAVKMQHWREPRTPKRIYDLCNGAMVGRYSRGHIVQSRRMGLSKRQISWFFVPQA
jgi:hypothetical protein